MMALTRLPTELLLHILSYLREAPIEPVAKTFNKRLTNLCLPLLQDRMFAKRNAHRMAAAFPRHPTKDPEIDPAFHHSSQIWRWCERLRKLGPLKPPGRLLREVLPHQDLLELRRNFEWLVPWEELCGYYDGYLPFCGTPGLVNDEHIAFVKKQAGGLGLEIPKGFFELIRVATYSSAPRKPGLMGSGPRLGLDPLQGGLKKIRKIEWRGRLRANESNGPVNNVYYDILSSDRYEKQTEILIEGYVLGFRYNARGQCSGYLFLDTGVSGPIGRQNEFPGSFVLYGNQARRAVVDDGDPVRINEQFLSPLERELNIGLIDLVLADFTWKNASFEEFVAWDFLRVMERLVSVSEHDGVTQKMKDEISEDSRSR